MRLLISSILCEIQLNSIDKPIKITDKKISTIGVALSNNSKLLLVGAYDGKIHILETKTRMGMDYEYKNEYLSGHRMAPLSIKVNEFIEKK